MFNTVLMPVIDPYVPYQNNSCDCGVYLLRYAEDVMGKRLGALGHDRHLPEVALRLPHAEAEGQQRQAAEDREAGEVARGRGWRRRGRGRRVRHKRSCRRAPQRRAAAEENRKSQFPRRR